MWYGAASWESSRSDLIGTGPESFFIALQGGCCGQVCNLTADPDMKLRFCSFAYTLQCGLTPKESITRPWDAVIVSYFMVFPRWRRERVFMNRGESELVGIRCEVRHLLAFFRWILLPRVLRVRLRQRLQRESGNNVGKLVKDSPSLWGTCCPLLVWQKTVIRMKVWQADNIMFALQTSIFCVKSEDIEPLALW